MVTPADFFKILPGRASDASHPHEFSRTVFDDVFAHNQALFAKERAKEERKRKAEAPLHEIKNLTGFYFNNKLCYYREWYTIANGWQAECMFSCDSDIQTMWTIRNGALNSFAETLKNEIEQNGSAQPPSRRMKLLIKSFNERLDWEYKLNFLKLEVTEDDMTGEKYYQWDAVQHNKEMRKKLPKQITFEEVVEAYEEIKTRRNHAELTFHDGKCKYSEYLSQKYGWQTKLEIANACFENYQTQASLNCAAFKFLVDKFKKDMSENKENHTISEQMTRLIETFKKEGIILPKHLIRYKKPCWINFEDIELAIKREKAQLSAQHHAKEALGLLKNKKATIIEQSL